MDLIETNAKIVRDVAENIARTSPDAVLIVVSTPGRDDRAGAAGHRLPEEPPMGQAGMLDTARFTNNVAEELGVPVSSVKTLTLGSHGDTMVPVPSRCTVDGKPLADVMAPTASTTWSTAPATAGPRSWRCSRPGRRTTRRPRPPPAWRGP